MSKLVKRLRRLFKQDKFADLIRLPFKTTINLKARKPKRFNEDDIVFFLKSPPFIFYYTDNKFNFEF